MQLPIRSAIAPTALLAALLLISACASDQPPRRADRGPPPGQGGGRDRGPGRGFADRGMLFVSPSGEPFRSKPGEPYPVAAWFAQADANHDGKLDKAEFVADAEHFFHKIDLDGDGTIDGPELQNYEQHIVPEIIGVAPPEGPGQGPGRGPGGPGPGPTSQGADPAMIIKVSDIILVQMGGGGMGGPGGGGMGGGGGGGRRRGGGQTQAAPQGQTRDDSALKGAAPYNLLAEPEPVAASDLSFAGRIGLADFRKRAGQRFDKLDADKDGFLTLAKLPKTAVQTRRGGPRQGGGGGPPRPPS